MANLEDLLSITGLRERHKALAHYAASLQADISVAMNPDGTCNEEKLVVLIFDAQRNRKHSRHKDFRFLGAILVLIGAMTYLITLLPKLMTSLYEEQTGASQAPPEGALKGLDKNGKPIVDGDGQPVLFEVMEGTYKNYDNRGRLQYEYLYKDGQLISKTKYDLKGRILSVENFKNVPGQ